MADPAPDPQPQPQPAPRRRSLWPAAFTIVALALVAMFSAGVWWVSRGVSQVGAAAVERATQAVRDVVTPRMIRTEVMNVILERPDHTPKLVVMTEPVRVVIERSDELTWLYVYWGTNSTRLELAGNRVQWFIDLSQLSAENILVDETAKSVTVRIPPPQLDGEMVVVQTDPRYVREETDRGWARLPASAMKLAEDARARIKPAILEAADNRDSRARARQAAETAMQTMLQPLLTPYLTEHGLTLQVQVREPEPR